MTSPLISIVIPCYNAEETIREAIQSGLDQTYSPKEIVVIDDGSTDNSLEVIEMFGDALRWESGPNRGGGAARNRGTRIARGKFIQFLDADDLLDPEKLRLMYDVVSECDADIVFCDGICRVGLTSELRREFKAAYDGGDPLIFTLRNQVPTPAPLHRKDIFLSDGGFREDLPCSQERDLMIRFAAAGRTFKHLPESLYVQRRLPGSVSSSYEKVLAQFGLILQPVYKQLQANGQLTDERAKAFAEMLAKSARHYLELGKKAEGLDYFHMAQEMHVDGGLTAYGKAYRLAHRLLGPVVANRISRIRRKPHA